MTTLIDGPAAAKRLMLRRCARFLRVVVNAKGEIDALDQPDDKPAADETIYAYEVVGKPGAVHLNTRGQPGGGFYPIAEYKFITEQPPQAVMMNRREWFDWTEQRAKANPRPDLE